MIDSRKHDFNYIIKKSKYVDIFPINGLIEIEAYSDKSYPKKVDPYSYEHFTLFCFKYSNQEQAKINFEEVYNYTQLDKSKNIEVDQSILDKHNRIITYSKYGGFIVQKNEWIYSLVETCREPPYGKTWIEYENLFLRYLGSNKRDSLIVLNADCGRVRFIKEKRTTHNNGYN